MASPNGQHLFIFGLGYTGTRLAKAAVEQGYSVSGTVRDEFKTRDIARAVPGINVREGRVDVDLCMCTGGVRV